MVHVTTQNSVHLARKAAVIALILSSTALTPLRAKAAELPTGANVTAGQVSIATGGSTMLIDQGSQNAIINWDSFSVGNGGMVTFQNGSGATLNRVTGTGLSSIDGTLKATGSLFLVNQNGIVIGKDGVVQTGGKFVASTLDIQDSDFLDGGDMTFAGSSAATVTNLGKVGSLGGDIAFIARHIVNEGDVSAPNGTVGLAAGREILMRDASLDDGMFLVKVGDTDSSITEAGVITAATVELRAHGGNIYALAGNKGGAINATGVSTAGGRIFLTAGGGKVNVAKKVRATRQVSGKRSGGDIFMNADVVNLAGLLQADGETGFGGRIDVGGRDIALTGAKLDASGYSGGGQIRVGGGYRGGDFGSLTTATRTAVDSGSVLNASATQDGNGGQVIVWANGTTLFDGQIDIGGGAAGGNGGLAETSGAERLWVGSNTSVYGAAPNGRAGSWLLDPKTITVATGGTATLAEAADDTDSTNDITIDPSTINSATVDVALWASDKITVDNAISNSSAITLSFISDEFDINAGVSVPNGTIMFDTAATSTLSVGLGPAAATAGADIQTDELALLSATNLIFGNPDTAQNSVADLLVTSFPANANITGLVQYNSLGGTGAFILAKGDQTYPSVEFNARDGIEFGASQTLATTVGDIVFNADVDNTGPVGGFDDLRADTGYTVTINSKADILVTAPRITESGTGQFNFSANSGAGTLTFERSFAGTIGIGDGAAGDMAISDDQLSRMSAASLTFGDTTYTTAVNVDGGDYSGLGAWTLKTTATGGVQLADAAENYSFGSLTSNTGTTTVGADITTSGAQTYNSAVTLTGDSAFASTGGDIKFGSTINGAFGMTVNTPGVTTFGGAVGGTTALTSLTTDAFGTTTISTGSIKVDGNTINFNDAVTLTKDLTITETGNVTFAKTVDSDAVFTPRALTINAGGEVTFGGGVGGIAQLFSLGAAGSAINMNGGGVNAILQTYTGDVVLGADAVLSGGAITFNDDVYGPHNLEITSSGLVTFDGHVGKESAADILTSLTVNGKTQINGKDVYTTGDQSYNGTLHITGGTNLYSDTDLNAGNGYSSGNISFTGNVTAEDNNLSVFSDGDITFAGNIGGSDSSTRVKNLETSGSGKTHLNGSTVEVQKEANFHNGVVIGSGVAVTSSSDDQISFNGTVDGPGGLEIDTGGYVQILKRIGGTTPLASLVVSDGASSLILGKDVTTASGGQDYKRGVFVAADVDFTDTGNGEIRFRKSLNSAIPGKFDANIQTGGDVRFDDKVGRIIALGDLDVTAGGTIFANGGLVRTQGSQTYNGVVSVQGTVFAATAGSLTFGSGITTTLPDNSLWLLAADDIKIGGDIQWAGTGDVTLVAGWDGSTGWTSPATTADTAAIVNAGAYGGGTGDISIGTSTQTTGISVGSRGGTTTALGQNMYVVSSTSDDGFAQLGFRGAATGDIDVMLTEDLTTLTAAGLRSFVQIGHGGYNDDNDHSGDISIDVGETVLLSGGGNTQAYGLFGHGGYGSDGNNSGAIDLTIAGSLTVAGGSGTNAFAQIGHGDASGNSSGTRMGDISAIVGGFTYLTAKTGTYWFGHATSTVSGGGPAISDADVALVTNGLSFSGVLPTDPTTGNFAGMIRNDVVGGDVLIVNRLSRIADESILFDDIVYDDFSGTGPFGGVTSSHSLTFVATGEIDFSHTYQNHGDGDINLVSGWDGSTGYGTDMNGFPTIDLDAIFNARAFGLADADNGDVNIGNYGQSRSVAVGTRAGDIYILAHDLEVDASDQSNFAYSQLGYDVISDQIVDSDITAYVRDDVKVRAGQRTGTHAQIGHSQAESAQPLMGDITLQLVSPFVTSSGWLEVLAGTRNDAYAKIGHGSPGESSNSGDPNEMSGLIDIDMMGAWVYGGDGDGENMFAQIGHGSDFGRGNVSGDITLDTVYGVEVVGGDQWSTYAQIGHGGYAFGADIDGLIAINASEVYVSGYGGEESHAQIGHAGPFSDGTFSGNIDITATDGVYVYGGYGYDAYAQIGHGGPYSGGMVTDASIDIDGGGLVYVWGGDENGAYAQIGHGGPVDSLNVDDQPISVTGDEIYVEGGSEGYTHAQIGHGGPLLYGAKSGAIGLTGGSVFVLAGGDEFAGAQVGHGSWNSSGSLSGAISINADGNLDIVGGSDDSSQAVIGHGGIGSIATAEGNISVIIGGEASIEDGTGLDSDAWVGHLTSGGISDADVYLQAFGFDRDVLSSVPAGDLGSFNKDIILNDIPNGDFTLIATGTGLLLEDPVYTSPFQLLVSVNNDLVLGNNATFTNTGTGDIVLAAGGDFHNDTGSLTPVSTGGRWMIYSTRPDNNRNDIEITNWDFLRYSTPFDISNPVPASFAAGNGLIYSVTPVVSLSATDETIDYGQSASPTISRTVSVNGIAVDAAAFGLVFDSSVPAFTYGSNVVFDAAGLASVGSYQDGMVPRGLTTTWYGVVLNTDAGDLTVRDVLTVTPPSAVTVDYPGGSRVAFGVCSPSEDDLSKTAYDSNTGQLCTLLPTEQD